MLKSGITASSLPDSGPEPANAPRPKVVLVVSTPATSDARTLSNWPRPAILEAVGIRGTLDLDIFGFGFRIGSNGLPAAVADGLGDHDRLLGTHHGATGKATLVDNVFRIGRIVVHDFHQPIELRPVIA